MKKNKLLLLLIMSFSVLSIIGYFLISRPARIIGRAQTAISLGDYQIAKTELSHMIEAYPNSKKVEEAYEILKKVYAEEAQKLIDTKNEGDLLALYFEVPEYVHDQIVVNEIQESLVQKFFNYEEYLRSNGQCKSAITFGERLISSKMETKSKQDAQDQQALIYLECGQDLLVKNDFVNAEFLFKQYLTKYPKDGNNSKIISVLISTYFDGGNYFNSTGYFENSISQFTLLIDGYPDSQEAIKARQELLPIYYSLVAKLVEQNNYSSAISFLTDYLEKYGTDSQIQQINGKLFELYVGYGDSLLRAALASSGKVNSILSSAKSNYEAAYAISPNTDLKSKIKSLTFDTTLPIYAIKPGEIKIVTISQNFEKPIFVTYELVYGGFNANSAPIGVTLKNIIATFSTKSPFIGKTYTSFEITLENWVPSGIRSGMHKIEVTIGWFDESYIPARYSSASTIEYYIWTP